MTTENVADPDVEGIAWDLDPLLDGAGEGAAGVEALLDRAQERATAFAAAHAGKVADLDGAGLAAAMRDLETLQDLVGRAGSYAMLRFTTATADPERGALLQRVQERATQIETDLLFFELEWAALDDERGGGAARPRGARLLPPPPPVGPALPPAPALGARGADPRREVADLEQRVVAAVRGAGRRDRRRPARARRARRAGDRPQPPLLARPRRAPHRRRVRDRGAPARAARARVRPQHAAGRQDGRRPPARLPALAREPQPRQRGLRRVRPGADRGGPRALRAAAPLVPAQGAAARDRPARGLRPHGGRDRRGRGDPVGARQGHGARLLRGLRPGAGRRPPARSSTSAGSTRPCAPASAAAPSAPTPCRAPRPT